MSDDKYPVEYFNLDSAKCRVQKFWDEQGEWSQATFGKDSERGPIGPLKHLEKEAREAQNDAKEAFCNCGECQELAEQNIPNPILGSLHVEIADCLFLTFDAARRSGMTLNELLDVCFTKLEVNKNRKWGISKPGEACEHVREDV